MGASPTAEQRGLSALDGEIRKEVSELGDQLESRLLNQYHFLSNPHLEGNSIGERAFVMDLQELKHDIDCFARRVAKLKAAYTHEFRYPSPEEEKDDDDHHLGGNNEYSEMVGLSDVYMQIRDGLAKDWSETQQMLVALCGMTALGKTSLAKKLLHDPLLSTRFHVRVFVSIGPGYKLDDALLDILKQVNPENRVDHQKLMLVQGEEKLVALKMMIHQGLEGRRYFVVLDDLWDKDLWYRQLANLFAWPDDGSHLLVTTTIDEVAGIAYCSCNVVMRFMDRQESWDLTVFGKEWMSCSSQLEKAGKKIAENCEDLPLTIVMVGNILSKSSEKMSIAYLNEVAAQKQHAVFIDAYDQMFKLLYPNNNSAKVPCSHL